MIIDYPEELPRPDMAGYGIEDAPNIMRTPMANGSAVQRVMYRTIPSFVDCSWSMTQEELNIFENWFVYELGEAGWFRGWAQTTGINRDVVQRFVGGNGPAYKKRLIGPDFWRISASIEIRHRKVLPKGWYKGREFILRASEFDILMNKVWP